MKWFVELVNGEMDGIEVNVMLDDYFYINVVFVFGLVFVVFFFIGLWFMCGCVVVLLSFILVYMNCLVKGDYSEEVLFMKWVDEIGDVV